MNREFTNKFGSDKERSPTEKEKQWKLNEEKQKAKQSERAKQLAFARPVSATEPWKTRVGQIGGDQRRPHSAIIGCDSAKVGGDSAENAITTNQLKGWQLPSEGEGDGAGLTQAGENKTDNSSPTEESREIVEDDIEDVLIADYEEVVSPKRSTELRKENTFTDEVMDSDDKSVNGKTPEEEISAETIEDQAAREGAIFTPLIPITGEFEDIIDEEDSAAETPTIAIQEENGESNPIDDDEDENGVEATIEAEKLEEKEADRDDQLAENQAEEHLMTMKGHLEEFVLKPIPQALSRAFRCRVTRRDAGCFELCAERASGERKLLMTAKKKKTAAATTYAIYGGAENDGEKSGQGRKPVEIGRMKANLLGTNFTVFRRQQKADKEPLVAHKYTTHPTGISLELAVITYEPNILGLKGPRRIGVVVPGMTSDGNRVTLKSKEQNDSIVARMKSEVTSHLIKMENKVPTWNEDSQSFVLNFSGRVTKASIKNFQIVHADDPDYIVFQFGRISETEFTLDFRYPLCPLQAFGCALSSMNRKLACE